MKKVKLAVFLILIAIIAVPFATADSGKRHNKKFFIGLWQGIDPLDGSEALRSITIDEDGKFQIIGYESYYNGCGSDRGIVKATGNLDNGVLVTDYFSLECYESGIIYDGIFVEYIRDKKNGTLIESIGGGFPPVILHRVNTK